jgi:hypothetical protein
MQASNKNHATNANITKTERTEKRETPERTEPTETTETHRGLVVHGAVGGLVERAGAKLDHARRRVLLVGVNVALRKDAARQDVHTLATVAARLERRHAAKQLRVAGAEGAQAAGRRGRGGRVFLLLGQSRRGGSCLGRRRRRCRCRRRALRNGSGGSGLKEALQVNVDVDVGHVLELLNSSGSRSRLVAAFRRRRDRRLVGVIVRVRGAEPRAGRVWVAHERIVGAFVPKRRELGLALLERVRQGPDARQVARETVFVPR